MKRTVIKIDENRCTGCGACVQGCHGGALQIVNGKARITNEMCCDGLGACIGECPVGAITLEDREAEPYNDASNNSDLHNTGFHEAELKKEQTCCNTFTPLRQFPIQLRLVNPNASFLKNRNLVLAADCTAFVYSRFQHQFMQNNSIAIACPKLDNLRGFYVEKLTEMIDNSSINSLIVILMEVPCCGGLWHIAQQAHANATRKISVKKVIIGVDGNLLRKE